MIHYPALALLSVQRTFSIPPQKLICSADYIVSAADADSSKLTNTFRSVGTGHRALDCHGSVMVEHRAERHDRIVRPVAAEPNLPRSQLQHLRLPLRTRYSGARSANLHGYDRCMAKTGTDVRLATTIWAIAGSWSGARS